MKIENQKIKTYYFRIEWIIPIDLVEIGYYFLFLLKCISMEKSRSQRGEKKNCFFKIWIFANQHHLNMILKILGHIDLRSWKRTKKHVFFKAFVCCFVWKNWFETIFDWYWYSNQSNCFDDDWFGLRFVFLEKNM